MLLRNWPRKVLYPRHFRRKQSFKILETPSRNVIKVYIQTFFTGHLFRVCKETECGIQYMYTNEYFGYFSFFFFCFFFVAKRIHPFWFIKVHNPFENKYIFSEKLLDTRKSALCGFNLSKTDKAYLCKPPTVCTCKHVRVLLYKRSRQ